MSQKECSGTLLEQYEQAMLFLHTQLNITPVFIKNRRHDFLELPEDALRELLINAIIHRNYHINGPIKINVFHNRVEIVSPGDFSGPITQNNLLMGLTYIRNDAISKIFQELGYSEKIGTGFRIAFESFQERGLQPPQIIEGEHYIKCVLTRPTGQKKATTKYEIDIEAQKIIDLLSTGAEFSIGDIIKTLNTSRATAGRKLKLLKQADLIKQSGTGKTTRYSKA